jgi:hypothetical protein
LDGPVKDDKEEEMLHIQCIQYLINMAMNCLAFNGGANPRMRSTSIANINKMVAHHLQNQGGGGSGRGNGRNRGFLIKFDPLILDSGKGDNVVIKMAVSAAPTRKDDNVFIVGAMAETVTAVNLLTPGRSGVLCKDNALGGMGSQALSWSTAAISGIMAVAMIMMVVHLQLQMTTNTTARMLGRCDCGFSFECFMLGIDGTNPLFQGSGIGYGVNVDDVDVDIHHHRHRPRVNSIIFYPTSFLMGGIQEILALLLLRYKLASSLASPGGEKDVVDDGQSL